MIPPKPLLQLLDGSRIVRARDAVKATIAAILPGVTVVAHPGKLDINDLVERSIVASPGVAVGYTRLRQAADPAGTWSDVVDFVAYIVADDLVDRGPPVRTYGRELVAHAIGGRILLALRDPTLMFWGLDGIEPPSMDPGPALTPVFTLRAEQNMTAIFAVAWTQALANDGAPMFGGGPFPVSEPGQEDGAGAAALLGVEGLSFDLPADTPYADLPPELQAQLRRDGVA